LILYRLRHFIGALTWTLPTGLEPGEYYVEITGGGLIATSGTFKVGLPTKLISYTDYSSTGNLTRSVDAAGAVTNYYYGSNSDAFTFGTVNGLIGHYLTGISRVFDGGGDSLTTSATWDSFGRMSSLTGEDGVTASFGYDAAGRLNEVQNSSGQTVTSIDYILTGASFGATDPNHIVTTSYRSTSDSARSAEYIGGLGRPVQTQQQAEGGVVTAATGYDERGRPHKTWKPYARSGALGYDAGYATQGQNYYSHSVPYAEQRYEASPLGRPVKTIPEGGEAAAGAVTTCYQVRSWNNNMYQVTTTTDESGNVTETWTDGWGRTVRTIADPGGIAAETIFEYDPLDNLTKVIAPNGGETTYAYDAAGNLTEKTSPDAGTVKFEYDNAGNLRFSQDPNRAAAGEVVFRQYDKLGRPITKGVAPADFAALDPEAEHGFESTNGNLHGVYAYDSKPGTDSFPWNQFSIELNSISPSNTEGSMVARAWRLNSGTWQLTVFSYDNEGRVSDKWTWTETIPETTTHITYEYNRADELTQLAIILGETTPDTFTHWYSYDKRGNISEIYTGTTSTQPGSPTISYTYTATGAIETVDYPGNQTDYAYNIRDWVTEINDVTNTNTPFAAAYTYFNNGNIDLAEYRNPLAVSDNRYSYDYEYDQLNRLTEANFKIPGNDPNDYDLSGISYDKAGNILAMTRNKETGAAIDNLTYNYSGSNRLQSVADAVSTTPEDWDAEDASFGYDPNGNVTSQTGKFTNITYDHRNLPTSKTTHTGTTVEAWYTADGQRFRKATLGGDEYLYIRDGAQTLALLKNRNLQHWNIIGAATEGRQEGTGDQRFYLKDNLSSTRAVVDETGTPIEAYDYDPWGLAMAGRFTQADGTVEKFTGKERDSETGTDHFGAREYDGTLGRWQSVDPLAEKYPSLSTYNYVANNPLLLIDPNGKEIKIEGDDEFRKQVLSFLQKLTGDNLSLNEEGVLQIEQNDNNEKKFGTSLIRELGATGKEANLFVIKKTDEGNSARPDDSKNASNGQGSGGSIFFNPNQNFGAINVEGDNFTPSRIVLGHELIHTQSYNRGKLNSVCKKTKKPGFWYC